jgi:hypothetical protein
MALRLSAALTAATHPESACPGQSSCGARTLTTVCTEYSQCTVVRSADTVGPATRASNEVRCRQALLPLAAEYTSLLVHSLCHHNCRVHALKV